MPCKKRQKIKSKTQKNTNISRLYGLHMSVSNGYQALPELTEQLNASIIQIHPTAPQRWNTKPIEDIKAETLIRSTKKHPTLKALALHAIYLINLAQPDKQKFHLSKISIVQYLEFCETIKQYAKQYSQNFDCLGTVVHPGSAKHYKDITQALDRVVYGINWIIEHSNKGTILLETSAGSGQIIGDTFEELGYLRQHAENKQRVAFCIDTQHMWASGYDFVSNTEQVIKDLDKHLGIQNIKLIHLNNSQTELGSHKDRHANLKSGLIPFEGLKKFVNHPALKHIPVVLETPACKSFEESQKEMQDLIELLDK